MLFCITLRIVNLGKPFARVDAVTNVRETRCGHGGQWLRGSLRQSGRYYRGKKKENDSFRRMMVLPKTNPLRVQDRE